MMPGMLCEQCQQQTATVRVTVVVEGQPRQFSLCEKCGEAFSPWPGISFKERIASSSKQFDVMVSKDPRYQAEAYEFVLEAGGVAQAEKAGRLRTVFTHHLTAGELLEAFRVLAMERFGKRAKTILAGWGVRSCEDVGEIIYNLISMGRFARQPGDRKEDFEKGFDFEKAFPEN